MEHRNWWEQGRKQQNEETSFPNDQPRKENILDGRTQSGSRLNSLLCHNHQRFIIFSVLSSSWLIQGIGGQSSPPPLPHCHPRLLDFGVSLANSREDHQRLKLYFTCLRLIWCIFLCVYITTLLIGLGERSFKHAIVLSKRINFSARGRSRSPFLIQMMFTHYILRLVLFWPHPTPHICLKMPKCAIFITFWESQKKIHPKYGSTVKNLTLTFLPQIFLGVSIYVEGPTFHRRTSKLTVTVTITVTVTGVRWTFQELTKFGKNICQTKLINSLIFKRKN